MGTLLVELKWGYWETWNFRENAFPRNSGGGSLIEGRCVYTVKNKLIAAGHTKTGAYVAENSKLDSRFRVKGFQEFVETNSSAPTVQLQRIRMFLAVIGYRRRNFRAIDIQEPFRGRCR